MTDNTFDDPQDLDWQAMRYAAGEMTPEEAAAFEKRMQREPSALEAVSRAVALGECLAAAGDSTSPPLRAAKRASASFLAPAGWMTVGALAASLGFLWMGAGLHRPPADGPAPRAGSSSSSGSLALESLPAEGLSLAWSTVPTSGVLTSTDEWRVSANEGQGGQSTWDQINTIPSWLLAGTAPDGRVSP